MHAYRFPEHEQRVAALAREHGLRAGVGQPRSVAADQAGRPRRHHGGRCLSVADFAALCGAGGGGFAAGSPSSPSPLLGRGRHAKASGVGVAQATTIDPLPNPSPARGREHAAHAAAMRKHIRLMFMMSSGGLTAAELFQGKDAILSGPAGGVVGMARDRARGRLRPADRLRHGRHLDRRVAFRRRIRARLRDGSRRRAHARADDADPHGRRRRRLDPAFRRRALPRRPGLGRRQSGTEMLPPQRAARRHRRQCDGSAS